MVHHGGGGLLNELENDLERLVVSVENRQGGLGGMGQQPMGYGQTMYVPGVVPGAVTYGPAVVPYQQQMYAPVAPQPQMIGMQQQMMPVYGAQRAPMRGPLALPSYDQGYVQAGSQPVMYGGPNEGLGAMQASRSVYATGYQTYPQAQQPVGPQPYSVSPQPGTNQMYAQPAYQQSAYQAAPQPPAPQPQPGYTCAAPPAVQGTPQQSYPATSQPPPQPAYSQAQQGTSQQNYPAASQPLPQQAYTQAAQPAPQGTPQQSYSPAPPPANQPVNPTGYANNAQPVPETYASSASGSTPISSYRQMPMQVPASSYRVQPTPLLSSIQRPPIYLHPQDFQVRFEPTSAKADTHHHALKSLEKAAESREAYMAIVGTYLTLKQAHESNRLLYSGGTYRHSRDEVQAYSHTMDKLESLSADFVDKHKTAPPQAWIDAMGAHRRHVFGTLYNSNELVRGFCSEIPGGPLSMPELDTYALGKVLTNFNFSRALSRMPNFNASLSVLSQVRTVILVDDSGSMTEPGHESWGWAGNRETRWSQARDLLSGLAPLVAQHSPHGIDLHFLNRVPFYGGLRTSADVDAAFNADRPNNGTPTGQRVNDILDAYMCGLRHYRKMLPLNLIIVTDGEAQDEHILHWTIEHHVTKIVHRGFPAHQFGIEFVQVGDCEYATRHLEKLEEEVSRHHHRFNRDVVGVTPVTRIGRMDPEKLLGLAVSGIDARMNGYMRSRGVNI